MDLSEAVEKAQRILFEEQTKSTLEYKYAAETGVMRGVTNESLMGEIGDRRDVFRCSCDIERLAECSRATARTRSPQTNAIETASVVDT